MTVSSPVAPRQSVAAPRPGHAAGGGSDFVARSVASFTASLEQAVFSDEQSRLPGLLQPADARAKVVSALLLLLSAGLARHLVVLAGLSIVVLLLAGLSSLHVARFARRVWLGIPLFAGVVAFPSLFLLPGPPLFILVHGDPLWLAVTENGLSAAALLVARVGTSVSLALLLMSTTRWTDLLQALRALRVPDGFVTVLGMTYRYLFLFLRAGSNLFLARSSRTVGVTTGSEQRRWAAGAAGALVSRSVKLSGDVLLAMQARGFDGEIRARVPASLRDEDWLLLALAAILAAGTLLLDSWAF